jgi:DNA-binding MurR/RpiR family transcriptional regulator
MLILERLQNEKFSDSQQAVIDYILANANKIADMTIRQIAKASYTSNATLIRIAHKLNYSGWEEFKEDFIAEQEYLHSHFTSIDPNIPFDASDTLTSIAHKVAELKNEAVSDTLQLLDEDALHQAITMIAKAKTVHIFAINNTKLLADQLALKLGRIGISAFSHLPGGEVNYARPHLQPGACSIVISYSGETDSLLAAAKQIKAYGNDLIVLTSIGDNSMAKIGDVVLRMCTREKMYSKISWYTSETSISYLLELLYSGVFWLDYQNNLDYKFKISKSIEHSRATSSDIMKENE